MEKQIDISLLKSPDFQISVLGFRQELQAKNYSIDTVRNSAAHLIEFFLYVECTGVLKREDISPKLVEDHLSDLKQNRRVLQLGAISPGTINTHVFALNLFNAEYVIPNGFLPTIPIFTRQRKQEDSEIEVLTFSEMESLFEACDESSAMGLRDRCMLALGYCGARRSELEALDYYDVWVEKEMLHIRKGKGYKERLVPIPKQLMPIITEYLDFARAELLTEDNDALFIARNRRHSGMRMKGKGLNDRLKYIQSNCASETLLNKRISLHTLRHTIGTHLYMQGFSLREVQLYLGHSLIETTAIYIHLRDKLADQITSQRIEQEQL